MPDPGRPTKASAAGRPGRPGPTRVLLVDDHPMNRKLGAAVLDLLGCEVETASCGAEALDALEARNFDLVLMDVHMPEMDGMDVARSILARSRSTPIIAMSADVQPDTLARCFAAGMVDSLEKPLRIAALQALLGKWCGEAAGR